MYSKINGTVPTLIVYFTAGMVLNLMYTVCHNCDISANTCILYKYTGINDVIRFLLCLYTTSSFVFHVKFILNQFKYKQGMITLVSTNFHDIYQYF